MKKYITQDRLKKNNTADILLLIMEKQKLTRREIERETGFSWGTVSSNVAYLIENGFILEEKDESSSVGRTSSVLKLNGKLVAIGLDINRTGLKAEIVGLDFSVKESFSAPFSAKTQAEVINQAIDFCSKVINFASEKYRVFSLGIALQGEVNGREGVSYMFPGVKNWKPYNFKEKFINTFNLPVYLAHDPKCALISALCKSKTKDCVLVRIDNGIGMAVCLDDKILDDAGKFELGHIATSIEENLALENVATMLGIKNRSGVSFEEAVKNDLEAFKQGIDELAKALYNVYTLLGPQKIILTGNAIQNETYSKKIKQHALLKGINVVTDSNILASFGAGAESIRSAIKNLEI